MSNDHVVALLEERRGYEIRGLKGRVAEVDAELAQYGVKVGDEKPARKPKKAAATVETAAVDTAAEVESPDR